MAHTTDRSRRLSAGILGLARRGPFATVLNGELQFRSHYNARNEFSYLNAQQARPRNNHATNDRLLRQKLELSQERMGRLAGVSMRTVARWENGDVEPEPLLKKRLAGLTAVVRALESVGDPADIVGWLETPDPRFHNQPPVDLLGSSHATAELLESIKQWGKGEVS